VKSIVSLDRGCPTDDDLQHTPRRFEIQEESFIGISEIPAGAVDLQFSGSTIS
jgi:hypothetical protein